MDELNYEATPIKPIKASKEIKNMSKKTQIKVNEPDLDSAKKKLIEALKPRTALSEYKNAIMGIVQLFVCVSIGYSTAVTLIGVDTLESKIAIIPQAAFALFILIKAFTRLYK